jgi:hypothetical protein
MMMIGPGGTARQSWPVDYVPVPGANGATTGVGARIMARAT